MSLAAAHARACSSGKMMIINGIIIGRGNEAVIRQYVERFALCRCLVCEETEATISVTIYEDEWE